MSRLLAEPVGPETRIGSRRNASGTPINSDATTDASEMTMLVVSASRSAGLCHELAPVTESVLEASGDDGDVRIDDAPQQQMQAPAPR